MTQGIKEASVFQHISIVLITHSFTFGKTWPKRQNTGASRGHLPVQSEHPLVISRTSNNDWRKWRADTDCQRHLFLLSAYQHKVCWWGVILAKDIPSLSSLLSFFFLSPLYSSHTVWLFFFLDLLPLFPPSVAHPVILSDRLQQCEQKIKYSPTVHMIPGHYVYV